MAKQIVVVEQGWVFLADDVRDVDNATDALLLEAASVIRVWGTTEGLGEIALRGPTKDTILDPCGDPILQKSKVLFRIPCTYEKD